MKKLLFLIAILISFCALAQNGAIPKKPNPPRLVNDFANIIPDFQEAELERKLVAYNDSTSNQIAIVTVTDLGGMDAAQFATELGQQWGVGGQAKFDNGIVILVSTGGTAGNRDAHIAVGYGLEGAIPDITAGHITDDYLIPNLASGNFYRAFDQTTTAIMQAASGEYKAPAGYRGRGRSGGSSILRIIFVIIILIFFFGRGGRGGGGGYMSRRGYRGFGGPVIFPGGFGGGGGGGFGGGGFGGFGGGGFGGGGAGGKW
jgi:uncharacterized protein